MALFIRYKRVESFKKKDIYTVVISNQNKFMNACIQAQNLQHDITYN